MKVSAEVRDRLAALARRHDRTLGAELSVLIADAEEREWWRAAKESAARLQADPEQWADYLTEADAWDAASADGLADAVVEWPEYAKDRA
jgi:hypothetical protein